MQKRGNATAVSLLGTSRLIATSINEPKDGPRRVVVEPPECDVRGRTDQRRAGPIRRVRIGIDRSAPLMTQVNIDLSRSAPYRVESSQDGNDLTLVFDEPAADPFSALRAALRLAPKASRATSRDGMLNLCLQRASAPVAPVQRVAAQACPRRRSGESGLSRTASSSCSRNRAIPETVSLDFQGADLRAVLRPSRRNQRFEPGDRPDDSGCGGRRASRCAVGSGTRHHPARQQARICHRRHDRPHRPADRSGRRRGAAPELSDEQALAGELRVLTRSLSYAKAEDLRQLLPQTMLSQRGEIQFDARTNTLIINDLADRLERASALITTLDRPEPQVEIEARIVRTTRDFARNIGIQWGVGARASTALGNTLPFSFPNQDRSPAGPERRRVEMRPVRMLSAVS